MQKLLDTSDFPPRWHCGNWTALHGWTHVVADLATFLAYYTIPVVILLYLRRKPRVSFRGLHLLFAAFILSCGTVHLIEASIFWQPWYRLSALAKVVTAVVSWGTVIAIIRHLPAAMELPELASVNAQLQQEVLERERAQTLLRRRNEELDEFAYVASHDLKAPLRAIKTLARWTVEDSGDSLDPVGRGHLEALQERVQHMQRLIDDLLEYSRMGRGQASVEWLDTSVLVRSIVDLVGVREGFTVDIQPDLPALCAPRSLAEQVFLNLITNAFTHHDRTTGRVSVTGYERDGVPCFVVEDDGPGIPADSRPRAFELFESLRRRRDGSTGIGLALVKKIVATFDGEVWMEDGRVEDRGSRGLRVCFTWPSAASDATAPQEAA